MKMQSSIFNTGHPLPSALISNYGSLHLLRQPADRPGEVELDEYSEDDVETKEPDWEEKLLCRECRQVITSPVERTEVQGAHLHTCANPAGILYQIGCFRKVRGCGYVGPATAEWSWFKGFSWRVAVCNNCLTHLGWQYLTSGHSRFHGLILNRLVQETGDEC